MKKILVISYFFPPCNLTASQRPHSWFMFLGKMGYYPIVITRKWEKEIRTYADVNQISSPAPHIEKYDHGEIHYLPYGGNLRDRLISRYGMGRGRWVRKMLSLGELFFENFFLSVIPYRSFFHYAANLTKKEPIAGAVVSAGPFPQFFIGYLLKKRTGLKWIADYRDDWSTDEVNHSGNPILRFLRKLNARSEKKWVGTASAFTTISPHYRDKIKALVHIPGFVLQNGFSKMDLAPEAKSQKTILLYNGTLYPTQPIETLMKETAEYNRAHGPVLFLEFPGLAIDAVQKKRVEAYSASLGISPHVNISARVPKAEMMEKQKNATALVMVGHTGLRGIPSSKIYEYLSLGKPIILFEPDGDILEQIVSGYNLGFVVNKPFSFKEIMEKIGHGLPAPDVAYIEGFSRESRVRELASLMDRYF